MKIIIIGAGIGGLSAYHSLKKHLSNDTSIKIYETRGPPSSTTKVGGGLGLAPNGLRAIASVSPKAADYIQARGFLGYIFTFRNSTGRLLGEFWNGSKERYGFGQLMVRRAVVHEGLLLEMPEDAIIWNAEVQSVRETEKGVEVVFANGSSDTADFVIGADGVWSVVRDCIFDHQYIPYYDGYTGVGGFIPLETLSTRFQESMKTEGVTMTFGEQGFFGYSLVSPYKPGDHLKDHTIQWWSIYEAPIPPTHDEPLSNVRDHLLAQHASWKSPHDSPGQLVYEEIINVGCTPENSSSGNLFVLPRYEAPRMPHWSCPSGSGRIVLLGDAAHVMPPDSGQGASCAVEDAVAIGVLLKHYRSDMGLGIPDALKSTVVAYEGLRMKRVWQILDMAKRNGNNKKKLSWFQQWIRDRFFGIFCMLPEAIHDGIYKYDTEVAVLKYVK
ncbi:hypothetical protein C0991_007892 [Blastosporella zonata]|nr:hypothetical protein C0991_007892 [Blastosporella zonata]